MRSLLKIICIVLGIGMVLGGVAVAFRKSITKFMDRRVNVDLED